MLKYRGYRLEKDNYASPNIVEFSRDDGKTWKSLDWGLQWVNHSPTGLNWGYHGSGCAQLAFAILFHFMKCDLGLSSNRANEVIQEAGMYQNFKSDFVAKWKDAWEISEKEIKDWIVANFFKELAGEKT